MTATIGYAALEVIPSIKGFESKLSAQTGPALGHAGTSGGEKFGTSFGSKASSKIHEELKNSAKFIVGPLIGAFAIEKIVEVVGESIKAASDLAGAQNRVNLVFGKSQEEVVKFSEHAAKSYGIADGAARNAAAGFGILFQQAHLSREENAKSSIQMVKLSSDLAAFGHTDFKTAFTAVQKGLAGATRGLKPYGVLIDSAQQKAEALRIGLLKPVKDQAKIHSAQVAVLNDQKAYNDAITKSGKGSLDALTAQAKLGTAQKALQTAVEGVLPPLTAQQKVLANQSLILEQTKTQQGQFGRSTGDLATQQKILTASWDNAKEHLGKGLLPIVTDLVTAINKNVIPAVDDASKWFEHKGAPAIHKFSHEMQPLVDSALPALGTGLKDAYDAGKKLLPVAKGIFDAFNSLPDWAQKAVIVGGAGAVIAKKSGLLSFGKAALTGEGGGILGAAKPVPVFVTNQGFGAGGGGGTPIIAGGTGAGAGLAAGSRAERISAAASEAAAAAKAAGAGIAAQSLAAARAGKLAGAAFDAEFLKGALTFGKKGLFGRALSIGGLSLADAGHEVDGTRKPIALSPAQQARVDTLMGKNPNLKSTATNLDVLRAKLDKASTSFDLTGHSAERYNKTLGATPSKVATQFLTPGMVTASGDVSALARALKLTPKQVRTVFHLEGISKARADFDALQAHMGRHQSFTQNIELAGPGNPALDGVRRP